MPSAKDHRYAAEMADVRKIQACEGGVAGTEILLGYGAAFVDVVAYHAPDSALVAGAILLGWDQVLRLVGWVGGY